MSNKIVLNREQQQFICDMFETKDVQFAAEKIQIILSEEGTDPDKLKIYIDKLIKKFKERK